MFSKLDLLYALIVQFWDVLQMQRDPNCEDPFGLLEVKCPETKFQVSPLDACSDPKFFCERVGNMCKLKTTHAYYAQVQAQMGYTGAQ